MDGIASIYEEQRIRAASAEPQCAGGMHWNKYAQRCLPDSDPEEAKGYEYRPPPQRGGYDTSNPGYGYDDGGYGQGGYGGGYEAGGYGAPDPGYGYDPMQEMGRIVSERGVGYKFVAA